MAMKAEKLQQYIAPERPMRLGLPFKVEGEAAGTSDDSKNSKDREKSPDSKDTGSSAKKKKNRCAVCNKKVGLTGFDCRCGGLYCGIHRYAEKHDCTYDYKKAGAEEIRRNNPVVIGEKVKKI